MVMLFVVWIQKFDVDCQNFRKKAYFGQIESWNHQGDEIRCPSPFAGVLWEGRQPLDV